MREHIPRSGILHLAAPCLSLLALASIALASIALTGPPLAAQEHPEATVSEEVEVEEVLLDVVVTDRQGNVVVGLDEDDFIVREDGQPVELNDVTFYSNRRFLASPAAAAELGIDPQAVPVDRYFVLCFHDQRRLLPRLLAQQLDAGRRARRWVKGHLLPNDYVAVASYDHRLVLHQDFTTDQDALVDAISEAVRGLEPDAGKEKAGMMGGEHSLFPHLPQGEALRRATPTIYEGLQVLARAAGHTPGRKNLILFSIGFGDVDAFGIYTPDPRYYPQTVQALNRNNVAAYTVDLIPTGADGGLLTRMLSNSLSNLASDTGGRYYYNFNNFITPLERIADDNSGYYLLSYDADEVAGDGGYRDVEVETVNPGFRVRGREGYGS